MPFNLDATQSKQLYQDKKTILNVEFDLFIMKNSHIMKSFYLKIVQPPYILKIFILLELKCLK